MKRRNLKISLDALEAFPELNAFCYGIDNSLWNNRHGIQFYDFDKKGYLSKNELDKILTIFDDDCIIYKSENGYHFISFAIIPYKKTLENVNKLQEIFPKQDYHSRYNLTLRISPKFRIDDLTEASHQPYFDCCMKQPKNKNFYSFYALRYYYNFLDLPNYIFSNYWQFKYYKCKYHIYRTRIKE